MIGRKTALILLNTFMGAVLGFVALKVFAVETGSYADALLGQLAFAMGIAGLLSIVLDLGLGVAHVKRISEGQDLADATATFAAVKVGLAVLLLVIAISGAVLGSQLGFLQDTPRLAVVMIALFYTSLSLRTIFTATFDGRSEFAKTQLTILAENAVRTPLMAMVGLLFGALVLHSGPLAKVAALEPLRGLFEHHAAEVLAACWSLGGLASLLVAFLLWRRGYPFGRVDTSILRSYWGYARHIFLAMAVGTIYVNFDKVIITAFWTAQNTGRYFGAQRFSDLIGMVPLAVYTVMFPSISERAQKGDRAEIRSIVEAALRHISLVVTPLVVATIVLAGPLLSLTLTGVFDVAVPTLRLLALYALVFAMLFPYSTMLNAVGRPELTARAAIVATVVNCVLNLLLVPTSLFGVPLAGLAERGAALATLTAVTIQFLLMRRAAHQVEGHIAIGHVVKHAVAGLVMGLVLWQVAGVLQRLPADSFLALSDTHAPLLLMAALLALGVAVYLGVLAAMKEFTRKDLDGYLHMLDPGAMARYIGDEVRTRGPGGSSPESPESSESRESRESPKPPST